MSALEILLHDRLIGRITRLDGDRSIFAFEDSYVDDRARATLGLSFVDPYGELVTDARPYQTALAPFFSNLLPEGILRDLLAARAGVKRVHEFQLLSLLGEDLPGALTVRPDGEMLPPDHPEKEDESSANQPLRFSLAGVQLKFSAAAREGQLTIPARGVGGDWIVKPPSLHWPNVPENEFAFMRIAGAIGIDVPETGLMPLDEITNLPRLPGPVETNAYVIRRFDRHPDGPIHIEDFAQVYGVRPANKYEGHSFRNILETLAIHTDDRSVDQFIRRLTYSILIGNADMHLKNWSLIYPDKRTPTLSPGYDFMSNLPYIEDQNAALKFATTKKMDDFDADEIARMADFARLPKAPAIRAARETVERFMEIWAAEATHLPFSSHVRETVGRHLATLAILKA